MSVGSNEMPRVVLVTPKYPPVPSGYGNQAYSLNQVLMHRTSLWIATVESHVLPVEAAHAMASTVPYTPRKYGLFKVGVWIVRTCIWLLRNRSKYDIIHILSGYYWAVPFVILGNLLGKPTIVKITSGEVDLNVRDTSLRRLRLWFLRRASVLVALTQHTRKAALEGGFDPGKVRIIPNGVDVERYERAADARERKRHEMGINDSCFVVLFVGEVGWRKGVDRLLATWYQFRKQQSGPARLLLVGAVDGSVPLSDIENQEDVSLIGHVSDPERFFGVADAFVLLSRSEGMANVLLEATAAGVPIVVSDIPPNRELAARFGGFVASGTEEQMICEATKHLKALEHAFRARSTKARNLFGQRIVQDEYSLSAVAQRYMTLYDELRCQNDVPARISRAT